ncbi:MAG: hypothetical protein E7K72_20320, partial [Roseomonas mucosa]|nr:hypothetical protein [Roseomonas mucosa]
MVQVRVSPAEFDAVLDRLGGGVPDAAEYVRLTKFVLDMPDAARLNGLDPFSDDYHRGVLDLYLALR